MTNKKQQPVYEEYHAFLKGASKQVLFKNYNQYLKQFSFFKNMINALPGLVYILNLETEEYLFVSSGSLSVMGYTGEEMMQLSRKYIVSRVHQADLSTHAKKYFHKFIEYTRQSNADEIKKYRFSVNYRFKRKDGIYCKLLQQYMVLEVNDAGYPLLSLGLVTDITQHKHDNKTAFSVARYNKNKGYEIVYSDSSLPEAIILSKREYEIAHLLVKGLSSKQIAGKLYISLHTVNAHRRNILEKTQSKNTAELINYMLLNGLV